MGAIEDLQNMMNRDALQYPFDRLQTTAILNLAARMDEAVKKIYELELASPCPLLKSICEDWEYDAKPSPDEEPAFICSGCNDPMEYEGQVHEYWDDGKPYQCGKAVKNLGKPAPDREMVEPPEFHDFCERIFVPGTDYRTGDIRMLLREHIKELREIVQRLDAGV